MRLMVQKSGKNVPGMYQTGWPGGKEQKKTYGPERGKILEILFNGRNPANDV